jgi:hypothetical protein
MRGGDVGGSKIGRLSSAFGFPLMPPASSVIIDPLQQSPDSIESSSGPVSMERRTTELQRTLRKRTKRA